MHIQPPLEPKKIRVSLDKSPSFIQIFHLYRNTALPITKSERNQRGSHPLERCIQDTSLSKREEKGGERQGLRLTSDHLPGSRTEREKKRKGSRASSSKAWEANLFATTEKRECLYRATFSVISPPSRRSRN